jgi:hypothetical protein
VLCARLELLEDGRDGAPSFWAMGRELCVEQRFRGEDLLLQPLSASVKTRSFKQAYLHKIDERAEYRLCSRAEERLDLRSSVLDRAG